MELILSGLLILNSNKLNEKPKIFERGEAVIQTAREMERKRIDEEFNSRVEREANRLGITKDNPKFYVLRDIYQTFGFDIGKTAVAVAMGESGLRCNALNHNTNGTTDHGIFQINSIHKWRGNIEDCKENIKIAYQIYKEQGFRPWVVFNKGIYKRWI